MSENKIIENRTLVLIKNALLDGEKRDLFIENGRIKKIAKKIVEPNIAALLEQPDLIRTEVIDAGGKLTLLPAFVDIHAHLREPGFEGKEDIKTGLEAAVNGGYAAVCCMPNTNPVIDNEYIIRYICDRANSLNLAKLYPIGAITRGMDGQLLADFGKMRDAGAVAVSDDGKPVANANMMRLAMEYAKDFDMPVTSHCEDISLVDEGVANEGYHATLSGLKGITRAAEEVNVAREIVLADALNTGVHIAHVSTKGAARLVRDAKRSGIRVTAETCPHYFAATDKLILNYDTNAKVNPPLRTEEDRLAIIEALKDGTIDAIATDHAPHQKSDKACEFNFAANGISGIETAYALSYTYLVKSGAITLKKLSELMTDNPAKIFKLEAGKLEAGALANLVLVDNSAEYKIDKNKFLSKGKNTPFHGLTVTGQVVYTIVAGKIVKRNGVVAGHE
ncbi:MAG: dihydroorotase [Clostridiaceae bacterium]|jgi:dihydroorotase|nr:dihydroorotase [Clostridiaceae bacterium]